MTISMQGPPQPSYGNTGSPDPVSSGARRPRRRMLLLGSAIVVALLLVVPFS
jgi:hypothetical protein